MKYTLNIILWQDTCKPICFKLGMMLDMTRLCSIISMTVMFTQGHRVPGNLELLQLFCCKVVWSNSNVCDGCLCKGKWQWISPVSISNMDRFSIYSSCYLLVSEFLISEFIISEVDNTFKIGLRSVTCKLSWLQGRPVSAANMHLLSICCYFFSRDLFVTFCCTGWSQDGDTYGDNLRQT